MRISGLRVQNFKRFTDLTIEGIEPDCKLVVLIGANGSGKSSVFDAFEFLSRNAKRGNSRSSESYERKDLALHASVEVQIHGEESLIRHGVIHPNSERSKRFFGRSSNRIVPQAKPVNDAENLLLRDRDGPELFILPDERFNTDLELYVARIEKALREAFIAEKRDEAPEIRKERIEPLNDALLRVFGDRENLAPQLVNWEAARIGSGAQLIFSKGTSRITYDLLSHGEKQVLILLLDLLVRQELLTNHVIFIDEMDNHLHRDLQFRLLQEVVEHWIPESSQLWTATHALGFIDYASKAPHAALIDLDELDFDQPQVLRPLAKNDPSAFDIAISPKLLAELAANRRIVFVEGKTDFESLTDLNADTTFLPAGGKIQAFFKAKGTNMLCLIDGDLLLEEEKSELRRTYEFVRFLPSYCLENELYHPDNIAEVAANAGREFDRDAYASAWTDEIKLKRTGLVAKVRSTRSTYKSIFPEIDTPAFTARDAEIVERLNSNDFDFFFPLFSAKDNGAMARSLVSWAKRSELASTAWFAGRIRHALS